MWGSYAKTLKDFCKVDFVLRVTEFNDGPKSCLLGLRKIPNIEL